MNCLKPTALVFAVLGLAACSSGKQSVPELDYQSSNRKVVNLEVPPDLTNPNQGSLYQLPAGSGAVRASDINRMPSAAQHASAQVLADVKGISLERDGNQRWLSVADKQPAEIWPLLRAFWQESGFTVDREEPAIGQMETEWAENRAKLPNDGIRSLFEKVGLGGIYSTGERDKFIIRLEARKNGGTDIFFAHKGMKEVYTDKKEERTVWQPRPNDANLEAAFLSRFMQYLGADQAQIEKGTAATAAPDSKTAALAKIEGSSLLLEGSHERNRRRTALALDRIGLTVVGQNQAADAFLIQAAPSESEAVTNSKPGLLDRMFGSRKKAGNKVKPIELIVHTSPVATGTRINILNRDGSPYKGRELSDWIGKLYKELR
ncbi:MAG: outer membrane protein assembly factor BamC [Neisseria sp.]|nr:outer membrane protein assembly factor BamC [Neisseria sp.]